MFSERIIRFLSFFTAFFGGVTSLRDVQLLVEPTTVIRGGTATLICSRDMQGAPLYSVKWYRGNHEFYRYTPIDEPDTKLFTIPGIFVDMNRSNGTQVVLRRMDLPLAGNFSCEVTADSPSFATIIATKIINVVVLPPLDPVLKTEKDRYQSGEMLRANCTSSPAKPPANLTIFVNDEQIRSLQSSMSPTDNSFLSSTTTYAEVKIEPNHFHSGRLRVACVAKVYDVYKRSSNLDFFTPETDPRPERITLSAGSSRSLHIWLLLFLLFLPLVFGQDYGTFDQVSNEIYYDEFGDQNAKLSLVGV